MRQVFNGLGASRGSALGRARVRLPHALDVAEEHISADQVEGELARLHEAIDLVRTEMHALRDRLHGALAHDDDAEIFHIVRHAVRVDSGHQGGNIRLRDLADRQSRRLGRRWLGSHSRRGRLGATAAERGRNRYEHDESAHGPGAVADAGP